jgi:CheY-like chemotaxis protein
MSMSETCILQVEDDANEVLLLQHAFERAGITNPIRVATDGQKAIDYLSGTGPFGDRGRYPLPGLILLDLKLPRRSGREVLQWIRARPSFSVIVVIVFASSRYAGDVGLAYELGANSFIIKPADAFHYVELARLLKDYWLRLNQFAPAGQAGWASQAIFGKQTRLPYGSQQPGLEK